MHVQSQGYVWSWEDFATVYADAQLIPMLTVKRGRVEQMIRANADPLAQRLGASIALYSVINALEAGVSPRTWLARWLGRKLSRRPLAGGGW
jgi:hypothetical protein